MDREATIRTYLESMRAGDLAATVACFSPDGTVASPIYGVVAAGPFYEKLFADTVSADVRIDAIYRDTVDEAKWAAHFAYEWTRTDGTVTATDLVDLFAFAPGSDRIAHLRIIFDRGAAAATA